MKQRGQRSAAILVGLSAFLFVLAPPEPVAITASEGEEHRHHVGLDLGPVYNATEKRWMAGVGVEYENALPFAGGLFGIGLMAEMVFDVHKHYVLAVLIPVHVAPRLTLSLAPGIMWIRGEPPPRRFAVHVGAEYELEIGRFSLAPSFEAAVAGSDIHLSLGLHIGLGF